MHISFKLKTRSINAALWSSCCEIGECEVANAVRFVSSVGDGNDEYEISDLAPKADLIRVLR